MGRNRRSGPPSGGPEHVGGGPELDPETVAEMNYSVRRARWDNVRANVGRVIGQGLGEFARMEGWVPEEGDD